MFIRKLAALLSELTLTSERFGQPASETTHPQGIRSGNSITSAAGRRFAAAPADRREAVLKCFFAGWPPLVSGKITPVLGFTKTGISVYGCIP
ncbi:MAG: hypothetical protein H0Z34_05955 [Brevibacillus sp.]|nr:hypothetical protein [Brevibacillus sp.]